jgi:hypothetical protein
VDLLHQVAESLNEFSDPATLLTYWLLHSENYFLKKLGE